MRISATLLAGFIVNCFIFTLATSAVAGDDQPFTISALVLEGDYVTDDRTVIAINKVAINNNGEWIVEARADRYYDCPDVILRGGSMIFNECGPLEEPEDATLLDIRSVNINNSGSSAWQFDFSSKSGYEGVYLNTELLIIIGDISTARDFSPGTTYECFFGTKINNNNPAQILVSARVDDPNIPGSGDHALVIVTPNADGSGVIETVVFKAGDILPGQTAPIILFPNIYSGLYAINDDGDVMFGARLAVSSSRVIYINDLLVAQENTPSPIKGRNWNHLGPMASLDLNNQGDYALFGGLDGDSLTSALIARNGEKLVQQGDVLPGTNGAPIMPSGLLPVLINDLGHVLWHGQWDNPADDSMLTGLLLDLTFLVREGVPTKEGFVFKSLAPDKVSQIYAMSDNGRYIIFEANLFDGTNGAFMIDFGAPGKCPWDINGDGEVGVLDLLEVVHNLGPCDDTDNCPWDIDGNGVVNGQDEKR